MTKRQCAIARRLRRQGVSMEQIADHLGVPLLHVSHALAGLRTPRENPPRGSLNVSIAALNYVRARRHPGEPIWKTVNRLFGIT